MKVLFDHGTPVPLRHELTGHDVSTAYERGWAKLSNGDLLREAEKEFDVLVTTDKNLKYHQYLSGRRLAIIVLPTTSWPKLQKIATAIVAAVNAAQPGGYIEF